MKLAMLLSSSATALLLAAVPAVAEPNYHTESTPAERVQTNALNTDAADRARTETDADTAAHADYDAARAAYERRLGNFYARKAAYENDRARYEDERGYYERSRAERWSAFHDRYRYRDILAFRSDALIGRMVLTRNGDHVGRIRDVDFTPHGDVNRVEIQLGRSRLAWIYADDMRYDPQLRVLLIDLSRDQIDALAEVNEPGT